MAAEFMQKLDKVYATIMSKETVEELRRDKVKLYPSSMHVKEDSESSFSQASVQSYPLEKVRAQVKRFEDQE